MLIAKQHEIMAAISGSGSKENVKPKGDSKPIPEGSEKRAQKTKSQMLDIQSSSLAKLSEKFTSLSQGRRSYFGTVPI